MTAVGLTGVTVVKHGVEAVSRIDLAVEDARVLALLGTTGSGKTTLLRAIAGLDPVAAGEVCFDGAVMNAVPTAQRDVAFVFQQPALIPHRTVHRNIAMPLELRGDPIGEIRERVGAEARAMRIERLLDRRPDELSLGEAHVVQIVRALVRQPRLLLVDEPFASIDPQWRAVLRRELMVVQRGFGVTTVIALHDPIDAMAIADRVAILDDGLVVQTGTPADVYDRPRTLTAARLTGRADALTVRVEADHADGSWLTAPGLRIRAWQPGLRPHAGRVLQLVVRPSWWEFDRVGSIAATVDRVSVLFDDATIGCRIGASSVSIAASRSDAASLVVGDAVRLRLARWCLVDPECGLARSLA